MQHLKPFHFPISSEETELLVNLKTHITVHALAKIYRRDISVLSRKLAALSKSHPVLNKVNGRWVLTNQGENIVNWAQDSLRSLSKTTLTKENIRIATTREFASRVLAHSLSSLFDLNKTAIEIIPDDNGIEELILNGSADFGFDCDAPFDPLIQFKLVADEDMGIVCAPRFSKKLSDQIISLHPHDYIHNYRNDLAVFYDLIKKTAEPKLIAHDIATVRALCVQGQGWSFLPWYAVQEEVRGGALVFSLHPKLIRLKYGIWWLRDRKHLQPHITNSVRWLSKIKLTYAT